MADLTIDDAIAATFDRFRGRQIEMGAADCVQIAIHYLKLRGWGAELRSLAVPHYRGAAFGDVLASRPDICRMVDALGLRRVDPHAVARGDLLFIRRGHLAIATGDGDAIGYLLDAPQHDTIRIISKPTVRTAWRVIHPRKNERAELGECA
jgi:hypothetical protein